MPNYWYSLVAASPNPETDEGANVAVVVGNGVATHLRFLPGLPRLCGLATSTEVEVYQAVLAAMADVVGRGMDLPSLRTMLGPQLRVMRQRALFREPSDELVARLCRQYLERPRTDANAEAERALTRRSDRALERALERAGVPIGFDVLSRVRPRKLYGTRLDRHVGYKIPTLARAVRAPTRDLLVDSVLIEPGALGRPLRQTVARVGQAFWAYDKLRPAIRDLTGRDLRTVGVLYPSGPDDDVDTLQAREYVKHVWSQDALVIDGNSQNIEAELRDQMRWLREGAPSG